MFRDIVKKLKSYSADGLAAVEHLPSENTATNSFYNRWENLSRAMFYVFAVLLPIWFMPVNIGVELSREVSFSIIIAAAFIFWLLNVLSGGGFSYRKSYLNLIVIVWFLVGLLSAIFSTNPFFSIFSSELTAEKVSSLLLGLLLMFLLASVCRKVSQGVKILFLLIFASGFAGLISLLQFFGLHLVWFDFAGSLDFNAIGTVNGLALFYSIILSIVLSVVSSRKNDDDESWSSWLSVLLSLSLLIFIANLVVINYRYAWVITLVGSVFLFGLRFTFYQKNRVDLTKKSALLVAVLILSIFMILTRKSFFPSIAFPVEVSPSAIATISIGKSVMREGFGNLLLGSGPATFGFDYIRYKDLSINNTPFWSVRFNQGFSHFLTILATEGILGFLAALLFLCVTVLVFLRKIFSVDKDNIFAASIFVGIFASVVSFALYPANLSLLLLLFLLVGLFLVVSRTEERKIEFKTPLLAFVSSMAILFLISLSVFGIYFLEEKARAAFNFQRGLLTLSQVGDVEKAISYLEQAVAIDSQSDKYLRALTQGRLIQVQNTVNRAAASQDSAIQVQFQNQVSLAITTAQQAVRLNEFEPLNWQVLGAIYENIIPFIQGAERFAFEAYTKASEYDPKNPAMFINLGRAELLYIDRLSILLNQPGQSKENIQVLRQAEEATFNQAVASFSKAIDLKRDLADAHFLLAQAYIRRGDINEAIKRVEDSKALAPFDTGVAFQLGFLYYRDNDLGKAEGEFLRAVSLNPNYSNARYFLGLIYSRKGDNSRAIEEFEKIKVFNPDNQEVIRILSNLRAGRQALDGIVPPAEAPETRDKAPVDDGSKKAGGNK